MNSGALQFLPTISHNHFLLHSLYYFLHLHIPKAIKLSIYIPVMMVCNGTSWGKAFTWQTWVLQLFVIWTITVVFFRVRRAENIEHRAWCYGSEFMDVTSCCRIQHWGLAWRFQHAIDFQHCQSRCNAKEIHEWIAWVRMLLQAKDRFLRWDSGGGMESTQSYDFICKFPSKSLLKTVIPGWLWRGTTAFAAIKKMQSCTAANL